MFNRFVRGELFEEKDPPGGGGGGGNPPAIDLKDPLVLAAIQTAVDATTAGLKTNTDALIGEKQALADKLKAFDGVDAAEYRAMIAAASEDETATLLKAGKLDEVLTKHTEKMRLGFETTIADLTTQLGTATTERDGLRQTAVGKAIDDATDSAAVALEAKPRPEAMDDIKRRIREVFGVDADGILEARNADKTLRKNEAGGLFTPGDMIKELQTKYPHYWPDSVGAGAEGGGGGGGSDIEAQMEKAASEGNQTLYRKLKKEKNERKAKK
jgi:hypothetical protein